MGITRVLRTELIILAVIVVVAALVGLGKALASSESRPSYEFIDADLQPFRESFNAASGHLRAVLLVGPT